MCVIVGFPGRPRAAADADDGGIIAGFPASLDKFGKADNVSGARTRGRFRPIGSRERRIGRPMRRWRAELEPVDGGTVFYPFSGPDLPSVVQLFPDADPRAGFPAESGRAARLERFSDEELENYLAVVRKARKFFGILGFFRTDDLEAVENAGGIRVGITGPLMAFAAAGIRHRGGRADPAETRRRLRARAT
jgi:hypothetical protein